MAGDGWYYAEGREQRGPVDTDRLRVLAAGGVLRPETLVWHPSLSGWVPASQTELGRLFGAPGAPPFGSGPGYGPPLAANAPGGPAPARGFADAVRTCLRNYAGFSGRASRSEFWWFVAFQLLLGLVLSVVDVAISPDGYGVLSTLASLALLLPALAVGARRLHDVDRSGWLQLVGLVPLIGFVVLVVFWTRRPTPGPNRFG